MTRKLTAPLIAAACAAVLLAACGGSSDSDSSSSASPPASMGSSGGGGDAVTIKDFAYAPADLTVSRGSTIRFSNRDSTEHTATATGGAGFDTGTIREGQTKSVTLSTSGTINYVCTFHPFMHGTVTVK
jgi:plastocyanin